jgi:hypothetical protein
VLVHIAGVRVNCRECGNDQARRDGDKEALGHRVVLTSGAITDEEASAGPLIHPPRSWPIRPCRARPSRVAPAGIPGEDRPGPSGGFRYAHPPRTDPERCRGKGAAGMHRESARSRRFGHPLRSRLDAVVSAGVLPTLAADEQRVPRGAGGSRPLRRRSDSATKLIPRACSRVMGAAAVASRRHGRR